MPQTLTFLVTDENDTAEFWKVLKNNSVNYTIPVGGVVLYADSNSGPVTITLPPAASSNNRVITIVNISTGTDIITVVGNSGSETINGDTSVAMGVPKTSITLSCDGSTWKII